jgi:hypothetical protein
MKNKKTQTILIIVGVILVLIIGLFFFGKWIVQTSESLKDYHPMMSNINSTNSLGESLEYCNTFDETKRRDSCMYLAGYYYEDVSVCDQIEGLKPETCETRLSYRLMIKEIKQS